MQYNTIQCNAVQYNTKHVQYLGFMFKSNGQDDEDMLRQMRNLYLFKQVITYFSLLFF